jgi:hypothetical protein
MWHSVRYDAVRLASATGDVSADHLPQKVDNTMFTRNLLSPTSPVMESAAEGCVAPASECNMDKVLGPLLAAAQSSPVESSTHAFWRRLSSACRRDGRGCPCQAVAAFFEFAHSSPSVVAARRAADSPVTAASEMKSAVNAAHQQAPEASRITSVPAPKQDAVVGTSAVQATTPLVTKDPPSPPSTTSPRNYVKESNDSAISGLRSTWCTSRGGQRR